MKASEFRIGNFVISKFTLNEAVVDEYTFSKVKDHTAMFEPIPLTEEWLVKFGFEASPFLNQNILYSFGILHLLHSDSPNSYGCSFDPENNNSWFREVQFVHQLQNLYFALTGEELTIKEKL